MDVDPSSFYNSMAEYQHLIFKDWESSLEWQASVFGRLLEGGDSARKLRILDCACGIGTQSLGLARRGHTVFATDLSAEAVARARREASQRGLLLNVDVANMCDLSTIAESGFDVVLAADVFIYVGDLEPVFDAVRIALLPGGLFALTVESIDDDAGDFVLRPTRRYVHSAAYLRRLASRTGLAERYVKPAVLRAGEAGDVAGLVFVFAAPA